MSDGQNPDVLPAFFSHNGKLYRRVTPDKRHCTPLKLQTLRRHCRRSVIIRSVTDNLYQFPRVS